MLVLSCSTVSLINFGFRILIIHTSCTCTADEVDPYKKPKELLDVSPKGLVPGLRFNNYDPPRALNESTIILEYLEECVICSNRVSRKKKSIIKSLIVGISLASGTTRRSLLPPATNPCT